MFCTLTPKSKFIRAVLGVAIVLAGIHFETWWGILGAVLVVTAVLGMCPIEHFFKGKPKE